MRISILSKWLERSLSVGLKHRSIIILIALSLSATIAEVFSISMFLPIFQFIQLDGDLNALSSDTAIWPYIIRIFDYIGITISLSILLIIAFSLFLIRQVITYFRMVYQASIYYYIVQKLRNRMFNGYLKVDSSYYDNMPVGNFVNIITTEVISGVTGVIGPTALIVHRLTLLTYISLLALLSWEMTIASIMVLLIAITIPSSWLKQSTIAGRNIVNANTLLSEFLVGRLRSPGLVRLSGSEKIEAYEFKKLTKIQRENIMFSSILGAKTNVSMEPIVIGFSLVFIYLSVTVLKVDMDIIGLYLLIILRLTPIIKSIIVKLQSIQKLVGSVEIIEKRLHDIESSVEVDSGTEEIDKTISDISFINVSYRYPSNKKSTIKNMSFDIKAHKMVAIVGPSGSGKSTLIDFLPRIRTPSSGVVQINGKNIERYSIKSVRSVVSYVPQTPQIFNGTVRDHVLYGKFNATGGDVENALELSGASEFVNNLPNGIDTVLGEEAIKLSGGQRQRLDLARALISQSPILVLDEPTSNLDVESERLFSLTLKRIMNDTNMIVIIVSHNLKNISNVDKIIVINNGRVEDLGTHEYLMNGDSWYPGAWNLQKHNQG